MWKPLLIVIAAGTTALTTVSNAQAQGSSFVTDQCAEMNPTWTADYRIGELIPLDASKYKAAVTTNEETEVRSGYGFDAQVIDNLETGEPVTIIGEAWDTACNQWSKVQSEAGERWIHGYKLRIATADLAFDVEESQSSETTIVSDAETAMMQYGQSFLEELSKLSASLSELLENVELQRNS